MRTPHNCLLPSNYDMSKRDRGAIESTVLKEHNISITKWRDNKCVSVAAALFGTDHVNKATL